VIKPLKGVRWRGAVLVGVDASRRALAATRWAAAEAAARQTPLLVVHAAVGARGEWGRAANRRSQSVLGRARAEAEHCLGQDFVHTQLIDTDPIAGLAELSEVAALLVLGVTGGGSAGELMLGSTTDALAEQARCPIVGVRHWPLGEPSGRFVLLGVDSVLADAEAIALAFDTAARHRRKLVALHVRRASADAGPGAEDAARQTLRAVLHGWRMRYPTVLVEYECPGGAPATGLLRRAADAEAVVLGSHKRGAATSALLDSTSRTVLRYSPVPAMIVGPRAVGSGRQVVVTPVEDPHALGNLW
jgi:nucleotide-binding universal stress UspA family protein